MKKTNCVLFSLLVLCLLPVWGQRPPINPMTGTPNAPAIDPLTGLPVKQLTRFDLDFSGGTPADLVKAIETATGKSMNAIIPTDDADVQLPALKMNDVVVPRLFDALEAASRQTVAYQTSFGRSFNGGSYSQMETDYGFKTTGNPVTDSSIWYFYANKPSLPPLVSTEAVCKFYQLQPYLNHGFTVDDITTAIQTGWKMAGVTSPPELNYHKETNLLIAFGKPDDLATIQNVLDTLPGTYLDKSQWNNLIKEVRDVESQIGELDKKVSTLTAGSTTNNAEK